MSHVPYRPAGVGSGAAVALGTAVAAQLTGYRARLAHYRGTWTAGYSVAPADYGIAVLVRYLPVAVPDLRRAWGDLRDVALDPQQEAALSAAAVKLARDGWEVTCEFDAPTPRYYGPRLRVSRKESL